jgi:4-hydroxy-4-methyl-2-oxoglutarate aldolase
MDEHHVPTTNIADFLTRERVMDCGIHPLWQGAPRIAGAAFTVQCSAGDNLMLHAAIYEAPVNSIIVVDAGDSNFAVAGGNVCAVAQKRGIAGFVIDGVIRDITEIRRMAFPVFARGVLPIPGAKQRFYPLNQPISCGGVRVHAGDWVVADEDGVVVIPAVDKADVLARANEKLLRESSLKLEVWEQAHHSRIRELLERQRKTG